MQSPRRCPRLALAGLALLAACGTGDEDGPTCDDAKCDTPGEQDPELTGDEALCEARRAEAFHDGQGAFVADALRWSCNDAPGIRGAERGQEYCEYFAILQLPPRDAGGELPGPLSVGRNLGPDSSYGTTEVSVDLSFHQLEVLEEDESAIVGHCVFSSWNADIDTPVADCEAPERRYGTCPEVLGVPLTASAFRMTFDVNSAEAAELLVEDCLVWPEGGDPDDDADPLHDDFTRGCLMNADINDTAFRKSDSTVCASAMRLAECNCWPATGEDDFPLLISPRERRGFPLGTWSDPAGLPAGCRHVDLGDGSQTVVTCDLSAADVLNYSLDPVARCRNKYADNVVVHVPLPPASAIECVPAESESPYADGCEGTPWLLTP